MVDLLVTYLEMTSLPSGDFMVPLAGGVSVARQRLAPDDYRALYRAVGEPLQWDARLRMSENELARFLSADTTDIFVLFDHRGSESGAPSRRIAGDLDTWAAQSLVAH